MGSTYFQRLSEHLKERKNSTFFLLILTLAVLILPQDIGFFKPFFYLFLLSFVLQQFFLQKNNYGIYAIQTLFLILSGFELLFGVLNKPFQIPQKICLTDLYALHDKEYLYRRFAPNCNARAIEGFSEKDIAYSTTYCSDEFSQRISCKSNQDTTIRPYHAIFTGCSFTFGEGLPYEETFPYFFSKEKNNFKPYNCGFSGWSPAEMCLSFDSAYLNSINNNSIKEDNGFCLYTYIDDHLSRVYGDSRHLRAEKNNPSITIENNAINVQMHARPKVLLAALLNGSETARYFNIRLSYPKTEKFYQRFANLINFSAQKYWKMKPAGTFYVSIYPGDYGTDTSWTKFLDRRIIILKTISPKDYESNKTKYIIHRFDRHPNAQMNAFYAKELINVMTF